MADHPHFLLSSDGKLLIRRCSAFCFQTSPRVFQKAWGDLFNHIPSQTRFIDPS
jgi:hypothetical protein